MTGMTMNCVQLASARHVTLFCVGLQKMTGMTMYCVQLASARHVTLFCVGLQKMTGKIMYDAQLASACHFVLCGFAEDDWDDHVWCPASICTSCHFVLCWFAEYGKDDVWGQTGPNAQHWQPQWLTIPDTQTQTSSKLRTVQIVSKWGYTDHIFKWDYMYIIFLNNTCICLWNESCFSV